VHDAPKKYIQEFINGYVKADGCHNKNESIQITTVSYDLAMGFQRLYLKLRHIFSVISQERLTTTIIEGITVNQRTTYIIREKLHKKLIETSFIDKNNYVWYKSSYIRTNIIENQYVYNFEIANDNSYIIENTIVHNCQSFSKAGFQKGFDDEKRGNLFFNICSIVKTHKPKYMILENVRNLVSHDNGNTWKVIKKNIDKLGYYTYAEPLILNALHFNIPQNRERVVILCKRKDLGELPKKPEIKKINKNKLKCSIKDIIIDDKNNYKYVIKGKLKITEKIWNKFIKILKENDIEMPKFPIWTDWWDSDGENTSITKLTKKLSDKEKQKLD